MSDLGLQTFAQGLLIEERPMNGGALKLRHGSFTFENAVDGFGAFNEAGDFYFSHASFKNGLLGFGFYSFEREKYYAADMSTALFIDSLIKFDEISSVGFELARNRASFAGILRGDYNLNPSWVQFRAQPSLRYYGKDFSGSLKNNIQQNYSGYDLQDISYDNPINIFRTDDNVVVPSLRTRMKFKVGSSFEFFIDEEIGEFRYRNSPNEFFSFFNTGVHILPVKNREDYASIEFTNKLLNVVGAAPTYTPVYPNEKDARLNEPRFARQTQIIFKVHSRF